MKTKREFDTFFVVEFSSSDILLQAMNYQVQSEKRWIKTDSSTKFLFSSRRSRLWSQSDVLQTGFQQGGKQEGWEQEGALCWLRALAFMAWLDRLEPRSSIIIWHPLNIVSAKERENLLRQPTHVVPLLVQQHAYRKTEHKTALLHFYLQLRTSGRKILPQRKLKRLHKVPSILQSSSVKKLLTPKKKKRFF